jgi:hypothetical protein
LITTAAAEETLTKSIVLHRDFFLHLDGYSDYLLYDVVNLEDGKQLGIVLLSPEGFEQQFVFDAMTMRPIFANARILDKESRDFLIDASINMSEVKRLAYAAKVRAAELKRGWKLQEGKPGNIVPKRKLAKVEPKQANIPAAVTSASEDHKERGHISNIRKEIE